MSLRFVCIHGHFYQPPRENPWLEHVERQETAHPYHDWNERIAAECYAPNAKSRILGEGGIIERVVNNYARMSFNFGPTLLSWMEEKSPDLYASVLAADADSRERFGGHGSALAQVYNHLIMPLSSRRDKETQVLWGRRDFEKRFGREPEGMWLSEAAVDLETLEVLVEQGIRFTILAPGQAAKVRPMGGDAWQDVSGGRIDPRLPYRQRLPSGRLIDLFFYDGPIARAVAFEGVLKDGAGFAERLLSVHSPDGPRAQLAHIACDGETFGHHHRFGDMALAFALHQIETQSEAHLTNYGEFLGRFPPTHEVDIHENSSWSCAHGIERWRADCGCSTGGHPGWHQTWRAGLRDSLDWLRDELGRIYEREAAGLLADPWAARNDYIHVVLDRAAETVEDFLLEQGARPLDEGESIRALRLLEMQRHALLMFTSCGWFFDDLSRIEPIQILLYAARAIQLAKVAAGEELEEEFLERLSAAKSNLRHKGDGGRLFETEVKPSVVDLEKVVAHHAVRSLVESHTEHRRTYFYQVHTGDHRVFSAGRAKLAVGRVAVVSDITWATRPFSFAVLHFGDHTLNCGVREFRGHAEYRAMVEDLATAFERADLADAVNTLGRHFDSLTYSIGSLFGEEQRRVLELILEGPLGVAESAYERLQEQHAPLMRFLRRLDLPLPPALQVAGEFVLNRRLRAAFEGPELDLEAIHRLLDRASETAVTLDSVDLGFVLARTIEQGMRSRAAYPESVRSLQSLADWVTMARALPFDVDLTTARTIGFEVLREAYPGCRQRANTGNGHAALARERMENLAAVLEVRLSE